jgi:GT2 family glycosyltransferase
MTRYYCTYFDRKYLTRGLALIESLRRMEATNWEIFVVCMDEMTRVVLRGLSLPNVRLIPLHEIEARDTELLAVKPARTVVEYYWTMTPTVILRILERNPEVNQLTYLDADLFFFSSPQPLFDELRDGSILIHEHRFSPAQAQLGAGNGKYNVGLLSFNRTATAFNALQWWRARCLEWCFARTENGKMGDQMYLNDWPERFKDVVVLAHDGGGVGPWNHDQYRFQKDENGLPWVNEVPVIFYHFHSFTQVTDDVALPVKYAHYPLPWPTLSLFFVPYLSALAQAVKQIAAVFLQCVWHLAPEQPITDKHTVLIRASRHEELETFRYSRERVAVDDEWECLYSNQVIGQRESYDRIQPRAATRTGNGLISAEASSRPRLDRSRKFAMGEEAFVKNPGQFYMNYGRVIQACEDLSIALSKSASDAAAMTQVLSQWAQSHSTDQLLGPIIDELQQQDPRLIAFLPQRVQLALGYVSRPLQELIAWLGTSSETTNLTYDLAPENSLHLAWMLSLVTGTPLPIIGEFLSELEQDLGLKHHIKTKTVQSSRRLTADADAKYGRRVGWYALVRALKPQIVVETGVDKGLGTCVLAAALMKNRAEGHEGYLYATEIDPSAGFLFAAPYDQVGKIIYGDSITTLRGMTKPIDLFIADSAHSAEYERGEYETVMNRLSPHAVVVSDNAHVTQELAHFAERTGRQFLYFQERPQAHFYPGAGMGIAYHVAAAPGVDVPKQHEMQVPGLLSQAQAAPVESDRSETSAPLVSVVVSAYESEAFMRECLEDLVQQTIMDHMEIIVVDAASPQDEGRIVKEFQARYQNIHYIRTPARIGVYTAWNIAIRRAKGRYITPFSTNDRLRPDAYEILSESLNDHPDVSLVYGDTYLTDLPHQTFERHHRIGVWHWPEYSYEYLLTHCTIGPHPMWRRQLHETVGYFDESYIALGDQDFWIRLGARHHMLHIPIVTGLYWRSTDRLSNRAEIVGPEQQRLRETYPNDPSASSSRASATETFRYECSVIIPVWNRCELTRQCLEALAKTTGDVSWELIVVDNHSTDETASFLSTLGGDVQIITNQENLGFAKACNQGARAARGKYLVFVNNDTIPQAGWLAALVAEVDSHAEVGIVGSRLLYPDGTIQHAGVVRDSQRLLPYHMDKSFAGDHPAVNQRREFQIVTAACLLIRRSLFAAVGGFDEGYVNGFEDADLCLKVRERGHLVVYQPRSVVVHLEHQTPGRKANEEANAARFLNRWGAQWWTADEYRQFYLDGYKLKHIFRDGVLDGDIELLGDIKDRASWSHVAAAQTAALKQDWPSVRRELALVSDWPDDRYVFAWGAMVAERLDESVSRVKFLDRYLELQDDPTMRLQVIRGLLEQQDLGSAGRHLQKLLSVSPNHAEGLLLKGILSMQREQYEQAEAAFDSAMGAGADRKKCLMGMGMAAMGRSYTQGAWERFVHVLAEYPDDAEAVHWLLRAGTAQNRWRELSGQLRNYVERNPEDVATRFAFASVLLRGEQIEAARREYDALRQISPRYDGLDELGQAITGREAALALDAASS